MWSKPPKPDPFILARDTARAFESTLRAAFEIDHPLNMFPTGYCLIASAMLNPMLRANGLDSHVLVGVVEPLHNWDHRRGAHAWIAAGDMTFDPTFGQFRPPGRPALLAMRHGMSTGVYRPHVWVTATGEDHVRQTVKRSDWGIHGSDGRKMFAFPRRDIVDDLLDAPDGLRLAA